MVYITLIIALNLISNFRFSAIINMYILTYYLCNYPIELKMNFW